MKMLDKAWHSKSVVLFILIVLFVTYGEIWAEYNNKKDGERYARETSFRPMLPQRIKSSIDSIKKIIDNNKQDIIKEIDSKNINKNRFQPIEKVREATGEEIVDTLLYICDFILQPSNTYSLELIEYLDMGDTANKKYVDLISTINTVAIKLREGKNSYQEIGEPIKKVDEALKQVVKDIEERESKIAAAEAVRDQARREQQDVLQRRERKAEKKAAEREKRAKERRQSIMAESRKIQQAGEEEKRKKLEEEKLQKEATKAAQEAAEKREKQEAERIVKLIEEEEKLQGESEKSALESSVKRQRLEEERMHKEDEEERLQNLLEMPVQNANQKKEVESAATKISIKGRVDKLVDLIIDKDNLTHFNHMLQIARSLYRENHTDVIVLLKQELIKKNVITAKGNLAIQDRSVCDRMLESLYRVQDNKVVAPVIRKKLLFKDGKPSVNAGAISAFLKQFFNS